MNKIVYWMYMMSAVFFCGCSKSDPAVEKLQSRISILESNITALNSRNEAQADINNSVLKLMTYQSIMQSNLDLVSFSNSESIAILQLDVLAQGFEIQNVQSSFSNLAVAFNGRGLRSNQGRSQQNPAFQYGIPSDVYDQISSDAALRFPNDYDEQAYIINEQVKAYKKLHP